MDSKLIALFFTFLLISSCHSFRNNQSDLSLIPTQVPVREHSIQAVLWQQHAAEYRALAYQAFNLARFSLDEILANGKEGSKPLAIVTDVDETVLDNSPYNGKLIKEDEEYSSATWKEWGMKKSAKAVPGALEFFLYAESKGVEVFYLSNRNVNQKAETMENLKAIGFPYVDDRHILLKETTSGKEARRNIVEKSHEIIMLLGDNLSDFSEAFDKKPTVERNQLVENLKANFGTTFIVFPNPMYGDWETKGIYEGSYNWTAAQKDSLRRSKVISY